MGLKNMIQNKVTLVLGAGSSLPFKYPVGDELRSKIIGLRYSDKYETAIRAGLPGDSLFDSFIDEFRKSQMTSIDAFLARRKEFSDIGKKAIATVLIDCEDLELLWGSEDKDLWQRYLHGRMAAERWDDLNFSNLSIVTFNYDRSLEHYLFYALKSAYGKTEEEVAEKLKGLAIVHVYGSLGPVIPTDAGYLPYGSGVNREAVENAANYLRVIPEGREDDPCLIEARQLLNDAEVICFLGFGFDETNLRRLNAEITCRPNLRQIKKNGVLRERIVVATCIGMTAAEAVSAGFNLGWNDRHTGHVGKIGHPDNFFNCGCLDLLRRTLILD
jgi:hypothetical protein